MGVAGLKHTRYGARSAQFAPARVGVDETPEGNLGGWDTVCEDHDGALVGRVLHEKHAVPEVEGVDCQGKVREGVFGVAVCGLHVNDEVGVLGNEHGDACGKCNGAGVVFGAVVFLCRHPRRVSRVAGHVWERRDSAQRREPCEHPAVGGTEHDSRAGGQVAAVEREHLDAEVETGRGRRCCRKHP